MKRRNREPGARRPFKPCTLTAMRTAERGVALVMALIVTMVVFLLVASTLYVITQATNISGSRKVYTTACEAADGSVEVLKDSIEQAVAGLPVPGVFASGFNTCLSNAVLTDNATCSTTITLPGTMGGYNATVTVTRLFTKYNVGARIKFPPDPYGNATSTFFRITTTVTGPNNTDCENSVVYKHV